MGYDSCPTFGLKFTSDHYWRGGRQSSGEPSNVDEPTNLASGEKAEQRENTERREGGRELCRSASEAELSSRTSLLAVAVAALPGQQSAALLIVVFVEAPDDNFQLLSSRLNLGAG